MAVDFKPCSIVDCNGNAHRNARGTRGWCSAHYQRWRRYGDPLISKKITNGEAARYFREVVLTWNGEECLVWPYGRSGVGYGQLRHEGRAHNIHRLVCEHAHGAPSSPKLEAAHSCGNRACCNPKHLRWDTPSGNASDKLGHGTHVRGERQNGSKLSADAVLYIRSMHGKMLQKDLASAFGVSAHHVWYIQNGRSWRWLE